MSSLQSQISAFRSDVASSASRLAQKRAAGPSSSQPSPAPSAGSSDIKRKINEVNPPPSLNGGAIFSQPGLSGTGTHLMTQVTLAVDYLRDKDIPLTFDDIFRYLSASHIDEAGRLAIEHILKAGHSKVEYDPNGGPKGVGSYRFRPPHNVRSAEDLLGLLQRQTTAQGIPVKELREGWSGALEAINRLEAEHRVIVTRNNKDNTPKRVWPDDPTLHFHIDPEFQQIWSGLKPPATAEDLRKQLVGFGLTPTSQIKASKINNDNGGKRKRKGRSGGGKVTNTHMSEVLKSYEHLRKF